jgi:hypothetical protein
MPCIRTDPATVSATTARSRPGARIVRYVVLSCRRNDSRSSALCNRGSRNRISTRHEAASNGAVRKYVARSDATAAIAPPASALATSATLSTSRTRPIVFSNASLPPVSSSTVS